MYERGPKVLHCTVPLADTPDTKGVYCGKVGFITAEDSSAH